MPKKLKRHALTGLPKVKTVESNEGSMFQIAGCSTAMASYNVMTQEMQLGASQDELMQALKLHESLHSLHSSPKIRFSDDPGIDNTIEDLRVNALCPIELAPQLEPLTTTLTPRTLPKLGDRIQASLRYRSVTTRKSLPSIADPITDDAPPQDRETYDIIKGQYKTALEHLEDLGCWRALAQSLEALARSEEEEEREKSEATGELPEPKPGKGKSSQDDRESKEGEPRGSEPGQRPKKPTNPPLVQSSDIVYEEPRLTIRTLKLDTPVRSVLAALAKRGSDIGLEIDRMERLQEDGLIFSRKLRAMGGTILIDSSGSMAIRPEHLENLMQVYPAGIVAYYFGRSPNSGILSICAAKGRRASFCPVEGLANIVDYQCLQWLLKQPGPRIFICDGGYTGKHDGQIPAFHYVKIQRAIAKGRVQRFHDIGHYLNHVAEQKKKGQL